MELGVHHLGRVVVSTFLSRSAGPSAASVWFWQPGALRSLEAAHAHGIGGYSMRRQVVLVSVVLLVAAVAAHAASITLTFEGLKDQEEILNYYNGGTGSLGSGPGPNYGIAFGADSLALISAAHGGSGNFTYSPSGDTIAFFLSGPGDIMDVAAGFDTGFSFFYTSPYYTGSVTVWDGLDGTGTLLATLNLGLTPSSCSTGTGSAYDCWLPVGVSFAGLAKSVVFSGTANYIGFDNITLGSSTPGGAPEPASLVMLAAGVLAIAPRLRRRS
jgi:hypothetical protein